MNENNSLGGASLAAVLDLIGLLPVARDRVVEIDRILANELVGDGPDAEGCASLVLEAADLVAGAGTLSFDWSGWDDEHEFVGSEDRKPTSRNECLTSPLGLVGTRIGERSRHV